MKANEPRKGMLETTDPIIPVKSSHEQDKDVANTPRDAAKLAFAPALMILKYIVYRVTFRATRNDNMKEIPSERGVMAQSKLGVVMEMKGPHSGKGIWEGGTGGEVSTTRLTPEGNLMLLNRSILSAHWKKTK
jgi:hypothetical protein